MNVIAQLLKQAEDKSNQGYRVEFQDGSHHTIYPGIAANEHEAIIHAFIDRSTVLGKKPTQMPEVKGVRVMTKINPFNFQEMLERGGRI